ncbi:LOW QUALITY PROTEIN: hypothetical protein HID58_027566 [Brassica napus]|uniref:Uncharacterized protein n=1 Tax=Brassica napus TaxID=3708 RepID=A0ABQ8CS44_BRANA|nr:LOW QUALITY PROTEIN: hypothetical protein HID58_027566 [Brassica napus]
MSHREREREREREKSRSSWSRRSAGAYASVPSPGPEFRPLKSCFSSVSSPLLPCLSCDSGRFHHAWRLVAWSEDAVVEKVLCGGESTGGGGFYSSVVAGVFLREVETPFAPPPSVKCFEKGRLSLAPPSSYSFRRVEATTALRCRLVTRGDFGYRKCSLKKIELSMDVITDKKRQFRRGESDDAFHGGPPVMKTVVESGPANADPVRVLAAFRGGADQVETVCDACRSEGADASTWHAPSLLDASIPNASVGWFGLGRGPV